MAAERLSENKNLYMDSSKLIEMLSLQLSMAPPEEQEKLYNELAMKAPITAALVLERFLADQLPPPEEEEDPVNSPPQEPAKAQGAPKKANKKGNQKSTSGKQRGNTRGAAVK